MKITSSLLFKTVAAAVLVAIVFGGLAGGAVGYYFAASRPEAVLFESDASQVVKEESAVIEVVEKVSPAVVSIVAAKDLSLIEDNYLDPFQEELFRQFFGDDLNRLFEAPGRLQEGQEEQETEISVGTGFIISSDGYVVTNRHVVGYKDVDYIVLTTTGEKYSAEVLARDSLNDLAVLKIKASNLPTAVFGDSDSLKVGQTVIAIGNALGEFSNTVSTGVVSGLGRTIVASSGLGDNQELVNVIQTDASVNSGNSGGPLLNLNGRVIGVNTAMAVGAENIGFAIPANEIKKIVDEVKEHGRLVRAWLGVRYFQIDSEIKKKNNLDYDYGVLIVRGRGAGEPAVVPGSPADRADLQENDIILEIDGEKITPDNSLNRIIRRYSPGQEVVLKISRKGEEKELKAKLDERFDD